MSSDAVVVRWLSVDDVDAALWPCLEGLLDDGERDRAGRFHFEHDRRAYVAAHALGRGLLSAWAGGEPSAWRFMADVHGKPEVLVPSSAPRLRLNLSHTRGAAAAVLTVDHDVGIDVEWRDRAISTLDLAQRFFAPSESALVRAAAPEDRGEIFLTLWTLKEAYLKATGTGLTQPLDSFAFSLFPTAISFRDKHSGDPAQWLFQSFKPTASHLMAVALRHPKPDRVPLLAMAVEASALCQGGRCLLSRNNLK